PILVWNAQHGWASLAFWLHAGGAPGPPGGNPRGWGLLANTAVELAYGGPLLFPAMVWALWRSWRQGRRDERFAYLALAGFPTLLIVALAGLLGVDRPNWAAPAYLAGVLALGALWPPRLARTAFASTLALSLAVLVLVPIVPALPPALRWDELYGWREVTAEMIRRADALGDPGHVLLVGQRYNQAAYFGYYAADRLPAGAVRLRRRRIRYRGAGQALPGLRERGAQFVHEPAADGEHGLRDRRPDGVAVRGPVRHHDVAADPEERQAAVEIDLVGDLDQPRGEPLDPVLRQFPPQLEPQPPGEFPAQALHGLQRDVPHEPIAHHDVGRPAHQVVPLDQPAELEAAAGEERGRLLDHPVSLAGLAP